MEPRDPGPSPGIGQLGKYRLLRMIGEGGMASVYLAVGPDGARHAVKRLHAVHFGDRVTVNRFVREARALSAVRHPNLVEIHEIVERPNDIYLVMEYLEGRDLAQVLEREGPLHPQRAARIFAQACDGLAAVHARGIIHRDLKPENLFLARDEATGKERVKLLDFGVARLVEQTPRELKTRSGQTVGTPMYMSPEQATASANIDARSDLYGIGVVMFEMLVGVPPFTAAGYGEVMLMHVNDAPPRLSARAPGTPDWLDAIVMRCLEKEPDDRYASATELARALRAEDGSTADRTNPIPLPPPQELARLDASKRRVAVLLAVAVLLLVAAICVLLLAGGGSEPAPRTPAARPSKVRPRR